MNQLGHPRVVVGVDGSLTGLAALRAAVAEARRRRVPLCAVRAQTTGIVCVDSTAIATAFVTALGGLPTDIAIEQRVCLLSTREALWASATDPRDLIVVGTSGKGFWHALWSGSVARSVMRRSRCPVLAVPAPEMARALRRAHRWHSRNQWDPLRELEEERPEFRGQPYSGI